MAESLLVDKIDECIELIDGWAKAYPESIFPETTEEERRELELFNKNLGMRISAEMGRHITSRLSSVLEVLSNAKIALLNDEHLRDTHMVGLNDYRFSKMDKVIDKLVDQRDKAQDALSDIASLLDVDINNGFDYDDLTDAVEAAVNMPALEVVEFAYDEVTQEYIAVLDEETALIIMGGNRLKWAETVDFYLIQNGGNPNVRD